MAVLVAYAAGAAIGSAIGGTFLGVTAAAWGGIAGSTLYNLAFAPTPHSEGPRLADLKAAQVSYGSVIPYVEGHPRLGGIIVWASDKRETATTTEQGGSGGGAEQTTYTYSQDLFYMLSENEVASLHSIFWNGELVWTRGQDATADSQQDNSERWTRVTFYSGAADQLPDATYEAAVGVGNAPAYRGRSTVFIEGLQLGSSGQLPNLTFVVAPEAGDPVYGATRLLHDFALTDYAFDAPRGAAIGDTGEVRVWGIRSGHVIVYDSDGTTTDSTIPGAATATAPGQGSGDRPFAVFGGVTGHFYVVGDGVAHDFTVTGTPAIGTANIRWSTWNGKIVVATHAAASSLYLFSDFTGTYAGAAAHGAAVDSLALTASTIYALTGATVHPYNATTFAAGATFAVPAGTGHRLFVTVSGALACANAEQTIYVRSGSEWVSTATLQAYDGVDLGTAACIHMLDDSADIPVAYAVRTYDNPDPVTRVSTSVDQAISFAGDGNAANTVQQGATYSPDGATVTATSGWTNIKGYAVGWTWDDRGSVGGNYRTITPAWVDPTLATYAGGTAEPNQIATGLSDVSVVVFNEHVPFCAAGGTVTWVGDAPPSGFQEQYHDVYVTDAQLSVLAEPTLQEVVERQCTRGGLSLDYVDASALAVRNVHGMVISQISSPRQIIEMLATAYLFTSVESEVIRFQFRGGASVATIAYDDLVVTGDAEPLPMVKSNDLELPVQVNVRYSNLLDDYQDGAESSDRLISSGQNVAVVELPLGFTPTDARKIADAHVTIAPAEALRFGPFALTRDYAKLEPSDVITVSDSGGDAHRIRLKTKKEVDGVLTFDAVSDNANAVVSVAATSSEGYTYSTSVQPPVDTDVELLDIPILRDDDNDAGFYAIAKPVTDVSFPGCVLFKSTDDSLFSNWKAIEFEGVFGTAATTLGDGAIGAFDESNSLTVDVGFGTLSSSTRDAVLSSTVNSLLVGSEVIQFVNATLVSPGVYTVSRFLRGMRGTEWAASGHIAAERVVLLDAAALRRVPMSNAELGVARYWKAVTSGRDTSTADSESFTDNGVGLKPFSPDDVRVARDASNNITITMQRRSRLACRLAGALGISIPLGEESERYECDVFATSGYATVKRTLTASASTTGGLVTFTYSAANQTTDFGSAQSTVYLKAYQLSAAIGRGYANTAHG